MAEMDNTTQLLNLIGGNLSGSLTTSDKLAGLSALMRSVTRGGRAAGLTPEAAISQLQQQKITEVQNRMQVQQLRAQAEQEAQLRALRDEYVASLPADQQAAAKILPLSAFQDILKKRLESQGDYASAVGKEYQDRVRLQGKAAADAWLALQGEKLVPVAAGGAVYRGSDLMLGAPAPSGVTFTPVTSGAQGGPTPSASGNFR